MASIQVHSERRLPFPAEAVPRGVRGLDGSGADRILEAAYGNQAAAVLRQQALLRKQVVGSRISG